VCALAASRAKTAAQLDLQQRYAISPAKPSLQAHLARINDEKTCSLD
jgi:hypothetical protein